MVDREHLASQVIERVGPGGNYLEDEHTLQHFRTEFWEPRLSNRDSLAGWQQKGSGTIGGRAGGLVREILDTRQERGLDPVLTRKLKRMCE